MSEAAHHVCGGRLDFLNVETIELKLLFWELQFSVGGEVKYPSGFDVGIVWKGHAVGFCRQL